MALTAEEDMSKACIIAGIIIKTKAVSSAINTQASYEKSRSS